jgi:hypothetical protein
MASRFPQAAWPAIIARANMATTRRRYPLDDLTVKSLRKIILNRTLQQQHLRALWIRCLKKSTERSINRALYRPSP